MEIQDKSKLSIPIPERERANLNLRLRFYKINETVFWRGIIKCFVEKEPKFMEFFLANRDKFHPISKAMRKRMDVSKNAEDKINKQFRLTPEDIDNVYEFLEEELPDL